MDWFKRATQGLKAQKKKELPDLWEKCQNCSEIIYKRELERNYNVCTSCNCHFRIKAQDYIRLLADEESFESRFEEITPTDFLKFKAKKKYADQLRDATRKTTTNEALLAGRCTMFGREVVLAVMDFSFIGGSMGSVVGERIALATDLALEKKAPFIIVSASGGARMQEGAVSLMQMAKTSARLTRLDEAGIPFISVLTHPTTGGVVASFSMLGDVNIAEPGALIGFAGARVIKQTIGEDLPDGFQRSEFLLEHGFIDFIVDRPKMKDEIAKVLNVFCSGKTHQREELEIQAETTPEVPNTNGITEAAALQNAELKSDQIDHEIEKN